MCPSSNQLPEQTAGQPTCLGCSAPLSRTFIDLGLQPLANTYVDPSAAGEQEPVYPLHARICDQCLLVQVDRVVPPEQIFNETYPYFSSYSESWLAHCRAYADEMIDRFQLGSESRVIEVASNDGYLLQFFLRRRISVLGIEPAANVARAAAAKGVDTEVGFFGQETARRLFEQGRAADLLAAKNVLAHVSNINDFVAAIPILLKPNGVFTVEFPHLLNLIREVQFDTIYHEHFTYLSLLAVKKVFERHGLYIFDVQKQPTHGGSLRVFAARPGAHHEVTANVAALLDEELRAGLHQPAGYAGFDEKVREVRQNLVEFLQKAKSGGSTIVGYGAAAKGNTLLNYCGVTVSDIPFVVDRNPAKQGMLLPGSHIPVLTPSDLEEARPDYVLILPWNLKSEIAQQLSSASEWNAKFVTAIPRLKVF